MQVSIDPKTTLCISVSGRPGSFGTHFHNFLFQALGLNFIYKAFEVSDIAAALQGVRGLGIRGCAVSMPHKESCLSFVDELDDAVKRIGSANTIVNTGGHLKAYNTDHLACASLAQSALGAHDDAGSRLTTQSRVCVRGSGGLTRAVVAALHDLKFKNVTLLSRNRTPGAALASHYSYRWTDSFEWPFECPFEWLINTTPIGMSGMSEANQLAFPEEWIQNCTHVFDGVGNPVETPLIVRAKHLQKKVITGGDLLVKQGVMQFILYTGITPDARLVRDALTDLLPC